MCVLIIQDKYFNMSHKSRLIKLVIIKTELFNERERMKWCALKEDLEIDEPVR